MTDPQGPKIIVDSDWKSQAQAEKERLTAAEKAKTPPPRPAGPGAQDAGMMGAEPEGPPQPSFEELVRTLAMQALMYLGAFPDPESGRRIVGLEAAKFNIDLLEMLEEKTKGNLTDIETKFLTQMLYELRMQYVEISKAVAKAVEQGKVQPMGGPGGGMAGGGPAVEIPPMNLKGPGIR
jgi:hypothetical protein